MRHVPIGLVIAAAVAVAAAVPARSTTTNPPPSNEVARCPHHALNLAGREGIRNTAGVVSALRRDVPRAFHNLSSMGELAWPKYDVSALYSLSGGSLKEPQLIHRAWATARRLCGTQTASRSWAVTLSFPLCQLPCVGPY